MDISKKLVRMKTSDLIPYEKNPRKIPKEAIDDVCESYRQCGVIDPIEIDEDNVILSGHTRRLAALEIGIDKVDCLRVQGLTDDQKRKYRVLANKTGERSTWDYDLLAAEIEELDFGDYDFDFEIPDIDEEFSKEDIKEDDYEPNVPDEPKAKRGQIYQLGNHRLMCGNSTSNEDVDQLINGGNVDMIFTDPPYGIDVVGKDGHIGGSTKGVEVRTYKPVIGDDEDFDPSFICKKFPCQKIFLWGANYFANKLENSGKWIVWDKNRGEGTTFSDCELCWTNLSGVAIKKYKCTWDGMRREGESGDRVHPTQKPIKLCADIICDNSAEHDLVLDLFGGSGSTLIACEQTNRNCIMMEIDPHYVDVIIDRWEQFTGKQAVLLNG